MLHNKVIKSFKKAIKTLQLCFCCHIIAYNLMASWNMQRCWRDLRSIFVAIWSKSCRVCFSKHLLLGFKEENHTGRHKREEQWTICLNQSHKIIYCINAHFYKTQNILKNQMSHDLFYTEYHLFWSSRLSPTKPLEKGVFFKRGLWG